MSSKEEILKLIPESAIDLAPKNFYTCGGTDPLYEDGVVPQHHHNYYKLYVGLARFYQPKSFMEIGVRLGYGMGSLMLGCSPIYVEGWDNESYVKDCLARARENVSRLPNAPESRNLVLRKIDSQRGAIPLPPFELITIDGDHSYEGARYDIAYAGTRCKVMLVDDYHPKNHPGVFQATNEYVAANADRIKDHFSFTAEDFPGQSIKGTYVIEFK